jgi:3D (Asp-Asp-Asp) domain-containing protein
LGPAYRAYLLVVCLVLALAVPFLSVPELRHLVLGQAVHVSADGHTRSYTSLRRTVVDVLRESEITVRPGDLVTPSLSTGIWPGIQINVVRALPVTLTVGGAAHRMWLPASTVGEGLTLANVHIQPGDRVYPDPSTALVPLMRITVERRETRTWVKQSLIPFPVQVIPDGTMSRGREVVRSAGAAGLREQATQVEYADGRVVSVVTIGEVVIRPPVPRVVAVGTRRLFATQGPFAGREMMVMEATAYYPGPLNWGGGVGTRTAIGLLAKRGVVAVDPSVIRLGSRVHVLGYGEAVAGDTGGAIRGNRIDLCFDTYEEAINFGRRNVTVYLLNGP